MIQDRWLRYARRKISSFLRQIETLKASDFPHPDGFNALERLEAYFQVDLQRIKNLPTGADRRLVEQLCARINWNINIYLAVLGFVLRSTNVRNAFEFFDPLLRLARKTLGEDACLILSSEWEFSPMTYPMIFEALPNFVLIGLPTLESENALVIPLAGHELGHSVWKKFSVAALVKEELQKTVRNEYQKHWAEFIQLFGKFEIAAIESDLFVLNTWTHSYNLSLLQCEEIFCDLFGVRIFGESFAYSFEYLLAPSLGGARSPRYPDIRVRTSAIVSALGDLERPISPDFSDSFAEALPRLSPRDSFILKMSDLATIQAVTLIKSLAFQIAEETELPVCDTKTVGEIEGGFLSRTPARRSHNLCDIINAGWQIYLDLNKLDLLGTEETRLANLNEIVLKSIEVSEFHIRNGNR